MKFSVVTTLYNSSNYLEQFLNKITAAFEELNETDYELIFVNDGSPDDSLFQITLLKNSNPKIKIIDLSKNFGHHKAIYAGLVESTGDYVFLIDSDLEEDPSLLVEFWETMKADSNVDVVYGVQIKRKGNFFERFSGAIFYSLLNFLLDFDYPVNSLTARLMNRNYLNAVLQYKEKALELWTVFSISGFNCVEIKSKKEYKGISDYNLRRKISMAFETITSSSVKPLYYIFIIGILIFSLSIVYILFIIASYFYYGMSSISGWSSLIASLWFIGGLIILLLGIISIYLSKIFTEVKNRPLYQIKRKL